MPRADNPYSRFVAWAKVILPLAALALLSSLFLLPGRGERTAIPFADVDIDELAREQRLGSPSYSGTTEKGRDVSLTAETARPSAAGPGIFDARMLTGALETDGGQIGLRSDGGVIDTEADTVDLAGNVVVTTADGYVVRSDRLRSTLGQITLDTLGPVEADGPAGTLTAGRMTASETGTGNVVMVFNEGVRLVYLPADQGSDPQ
ncbi:hypothetical protein RM543_02545 [Roseicyclus sp. F158]|uniref:Lipopolysaccharide export system protein LptC n=1 Tax=Tropicimonas omnivorans TaxID=3075590 RepID=A0ABU3DCW3_9RHOB|nr:LPS export ABC transporter periplasmic protein LptC [Roseicyclus sp. F158]MDT0681550.1 hypothetical protein [Roseicyclus sp. F158]